MKKLYSYIIVFIIGCLLSWYITSINVKPEVILQKQTKVIYKLKKEIAIQDQKVKSNKFLWVFNKDNIIWGSIGYVIGAVL